MTDDFPETKQFDAPIVEQKESIKLMKMSKGYNWEIKVFIQFDDSVRDEGKNINYDRDLDSIGRLEKIDSELKKKFMKEEK